MARNFKKIKAWQVADDLVVWIYEIIRGFPHEEVFGLVSQMRRAAVSVAANIAEGSARESEKDYLHFLNMSESSLSELEYYVYLSNRLGYLKKELFDKSISRQKETAWTLIGLMKSVREEL